MTDVEALEITRFIAARDPPGREVAWAHLIARYTRLLLKVARSLGGGNDAVMDRYAFVLERLREDDFRRLRSYRPDGPARFSTWLVVAARRLCVDHHRARFGRMVAVNAAQDSQRAIRRRLVLDEGASADLSSFIDTTTQSASDSLEARERERALTDALAELPPRDRLLLQLRYRDDLTAGAIAEAMEFPTQFHVYRRVNALVAALRIRLRQFDGPT